MAVDLMRRAGDLPLTEGLRVETDLSTVSCRTQDAEEGIAAFEEKRKARFMDA